MGRDLRDYVGIAHQYARDVVEGRIPACAYVKQACQRQLDDLAREWTDEFPYVFATTLAERVCRFVEHLPHIKGKWAGKPIVMEPWQVFILSTVFGWVREDGSRRFRVVYTEVPRKNAKSTISSGVGLYLLAADEEGGAEVYSAATTRDQARIVWNDAKCMVDRTEGLRRRFGVSTGAHSIYVEDTASLFKALSRDQGGNLDGLNVHGAIIDELHAHKTREIYDVVETATGARTQPLIWNITTAGFNRAGICYELRGYAAGVLSGAAPDEEFFGIIYTVDDEDLKDVGRLLTDPTLWAKANPNWGISVSPDDIARKARKASRVSSAQNNFLTKHLNVWVNAGTSWMNMQRWEECANRDLRLEDFAGEQCVAGLDLSSKKDIAALVYLFNRDGKLHILGRYYLPEAAVEDSTNSQYAGWVEDGLLTVTPGNVLDYGQIEDDLHADSSQMEITEVGYDPFQATQMASRLDQAGFSMVEVRPTVPNFSEPMKELEALVLQGAIVHDGSPILTWMISNVVAHVDAKDNIYPRKSRPDAKIDGVVALLMALNRHIAGAGEEMTASMIIGRA